MADLNLQIELNPELARYEPGSQLTGRVTISSPTGPWKADAIDLVLFWRTSGLGTRDSGVGTSIALAQKGTEIPSHFAREFELSVPLHPYTYNGRLIKIDWFVGLRVKKGWLSKQELEIPVMVRPVVAAEAEGPDTDAYGEGGIPAV